MRATAVLLLNVGTEVIEMEKLVTIGSGRTLFKQGDKGGDLYFIKSGTVELSVRDPETGDEAIVATLGARAVIGTMSFLENDPRSATAIAKTELQVVIVSQVQRDKLLTQVPTWFQVLLKDQSASLRRLNDQFVKVKNEGKLIDKKLKVKEKQKAESDAEIEKLRQEITALKEQHSQELTTQKTQHQQEVAELNKQLAALKTKK